MNNDPHRYHRRSIRLQGYDYSKPNTFFVTLCAKDRECLFGEVDSGNMKLNDAGRLVEQAWQGLTRYSSIVLDLWVLMPNHFHGIISINDDEGRVGSAYAAAPTSKPLGRLIGAFKTVSTKHINQLRGVPGALVWQRNYYEHIIRNEDSLNCIRRYIENNPMRWEFDQENPGAVTIDHEVC